MIEAGLFALSACAAFALGAALASWRGVSRSGPGDTHISLRKQTPSTVESAPTLALLYKKSTTQTAGDQTASEDRRRHCRTREQG